MPLAVTDLTTRGDLTAEQQRAVDRRGESLLLSAGAGSGKTSVLVERFVRAVTDDGLSAGRILAITFTERAAGELRERTRARFLELGEREAARDIEAAFISTFHSFCLRLLRTHSLLAGLDPDFRILEEGLADRLRTLAFADALKGFLTAGDSPAVDLIAAYGSDRVQSMILNVYAELRSRGESQPTLPEPQVKEATKANVQQLILSVADASKELNDAFSQRPGKRLEQALQTLAQADLLLAEAPDVEHIPLPGALAALKLQAGSTGPLAGPACQTYRALHLQYTQACADFHGARACGQLGELLQRFGHSYTEQKRRRGVLDFDDLELHARSLLQSDSDIRCAWAERFELLMVDEFQDTNPRQLAILSALERENLFTVGDEFQSIYGFRHAEVNLFRARRERLASDNATLVLSRNFRGRPALLDAVNTVFMDRFASDYEPLEPGREQHTQEDPLIELLLTDKSGWEDQKTKDDDLPSGTAWRTAEARQLARRISDLINTAKAKPGEIVVLLRAMGDLALYDRALAEHDLPTLAVVGGFWTHQQVSDLLAYLRVLANPLDEHALYGTLASPLVGLSSDALALLSKAARGSGRGVWEAAKAIFLDPTDPHTQTEPEHALRFGLEDRSRLSTFCARLSAERNALGRYTISELLERAITASGYTEYVLSLQSGQRRLANVHKLLRLARTFEATERHSLRDFLEHVAHLQDALKAREPDAPVADDDVDAIRLMSIHAAKGLEFPVVCVADLGRATNIRAPDLLIDKRDSPHGRVGLQFVCLDGAGPVSTLDFPLLRQERQKEEAEEEQRILYVAMTRARERLLLSAAVDFSSWPEQKPGAPSISWLGPALIKDLPERLLSAGPIEDLELPGAFRARVRCTLNTPGPGAELLHLESLAAKSPVRRAFSDELTAPDEAHRTAVEQTSKAERPLDLKTVLRQGTVSYTSLTELERCGYRYYLERVLGVPEDHGAESTKDSTGALEARARGVLIHRLLESLDFASANVPSPDTVTLTARELGVTLSAQQGKEVALLISSAIKSPLAKRLACAWQLRHEQPFAFFLRPDEPLVTGVLDLVAHEAGAGWLIVDYKSDRLADEQDLKDTVQRDYEMQRLLYALAALRGGAPQVEVVHWFLERPKEPVSVSFSAKDTQKLSDELLDRLGRLTTEGFSVSQTPHRGLCQTCPGRRGLCSWGPSQTQRESPQTTPPAKVSGQRLSPSMIRA